MYWHFMSSRKVIKKLAFYAIKEIDKTLTFYLIIEIDKILALYYHQGNYQYIGILWHQGNSLIWHADLFKSKYILQTTRNATMHRYCY